MTEEREYDPNATVHEIIVNLLLLTLPAEMRAAAPDLADRVFEHPEVAPHIGKRWGELSEGESYIVAREAGVVARDVEIGAGSATQLGGERLH